MNDMKNDMKRCHSLWRFLQRLLRLSDLCCKLLVVMVEDFKSLSNLKDNKLTFLAACNLGLLLHLLHLIYIQIPAPTEEDDAVCQAARYVIHTGIFPSINSFYVSAE